MNVQFCYGTLEALMNRPITPGCLYFILDTQQIWMDSPEGMRFCYTEAQSLEGEMEAISEQELREMLK